MRKGHPIPDTTDHAIQGGRRSQLQITGEPPLRLVADRPDDTGRKDRGEPGDPAGAEKSLEIREPESAGQDPRGSDDEDSDQTDEQTLVLDVSRHGQATDPRHPVERPAFLEIAAEQKHGDGGIESHAAVHRTAQQEILQAEREDQQEKQKAEAP